MSRLCSLYQALLPGIVFIGLLFGLCPVNAAVVEFDSGTYYPCDPNIVNPGKPSYQALRDFLYSVRDDPNEPPIMSLLFLRDFSVDGDPIIVASDGSPIIAVKISDQPEKHEPAEPDVLFVGGIHGDEPLGVRLLLEFIEFLTENYDSDPEVRAWVDAYEIWIIPVLNPWGFDNTSRNNANDVDLNRNFDFLHSQSESEYKGPYEFSEPESRALGEFVLNFRPVLGAIFHSGADDREIMRPWSPKPPPADAVRLLEVADVFAAAAANGLVHKRTGVGGSTNFNHAKTGMFDYIVEMDPNKRECSDPKWSFFCDLDLSLYDLPEYWIEKAHLNLAETLVDRYLNGLTALLDDFLFDSSPPYQYTGPGLTGKVFDCVTGDKIAGATINITSTADPLDDRDGDGLIEDYDDRNADALDFAFSLAPGGYRCPDATGAWIMHDYSETTDYTAGEQNCSHWTGVALNEIVVSTTSTDREFVELVGNPGDSLDDLSLLEVGPDGEILTEHDLSGETIPVDGFWLAASPEAELILGVDADYSIPNNTFPNESRTYLLVDGFAGKEGEDIDDDDDGIADNTPWLSIVDSVALIAIDDEPPLVYSANVVGPKNSPKSEPDGTIEDDEVGAVKFRTTDDLFGQYLRLLPRLLPLNPSGTTTLVTDWDVYVEHPGYDDWHSIVSVTEHETGVALQELDIALDSGIDSDGDMLSNCFELGLGTNPNDPDSDMDALNDGDEVAQGTDPLNPDSDADLLQDGHEIKIGTDPLDSDTDDDGFSDGQEVYDYHTDPLDPDSDDDGILDGSDPGVIAAFVASLPPSVFLDSSPGLQIATLTILSDAERKIASGKVSVGIKMLQNLRTHYDGCSSSSGLPDDDWIIDCNVQLEVRDLHDLVVHNLKQ